jgi:hypothetical protein
MTSQLLSGSNPQSVPLFCHDNRPSFKFTTRFAVCVAERPSLEDSDGGENQCRIFLQNSRSIHLESRTQKTNNLLHILHGQRTTGMCLTRRFCGWGLKGQEVYCIAQAGPSNCFPRHSWSAPGLPRRYTCALPQSHRKCLRCPIY